MPKKKFFFGQIVNPMKHCETHAMGTGFSGGVNGQPIPAPLPTCIRDNPYQQVLCSNK